MLAACDNFRAGAVEQIKTHVYSIHYTKLLILAMKGRNLDIPVYDRGYKEDPAIIA